MSSKNRAVVSKRCVICDRKHRRKSLTCSERHRATLRRWQLRHRPKPIFEAPIADAICPICKHPVLVDTNNGWVRYHVDCRKIARNWHAKGVAIS
jgi:hypothetical protein